MSEVVLLKIGGVPVYYDDEARRCWWTGEMTIDLDGCPRAYGPEGCEPEPYDWLANAGYPGNWWGVATDDMGEPVEQDSGDRECWPHPGLYISTTAYLVPGYDEFDCRRYVDSERISFLVVPGNVRMSIEPKFLGCKGRITDVHSGKRINAVVADVGPSNHLGEASMKAARRFGLNPYPKEGNAGSSDRSRWLYECWPGKQARGFVLQ